MGQLSCAISACAFRFIIRGHKEPNQSGEKASKLHAIRRFLAFYSPPGSVISAHLHKMRKLRVFVVVFGIFLPYLARIPRGLSWLSDYTNGGLAGFLLMGAFNAIAWGSIVGLSSWYQRPSSILFPAVFGFGYLAWAHFSLDMRSDAQAAIALVFIPIYALLPILIGALIGYFVDRRP